MPKLYIANVTPQQQIITYRLDYASDGLRDPRVMIPARMTPPIPSGRQHPFGEMALSQIESIVTQLEHYGLVAQKDLGRLPRGRKVTYLFNVDREVSAEAIRQAHAHNQGVRIDDGRERRKRAALGASDIVLKTVAEKSDVPAEMTGFEMSIEQDEQSELGESRIEEGYKVDVKAAAEPGGEPAGGRRGRRARPAA
jgi:hypothetical protein